MPPGPGPSGMPALLLSNYRGWVSANATVGLFLSVYDEEANRTFSEATRELKQVINISHCEQYLARNTHSNMETLTGTGG